MAAVEERKKLFIRPDGKEKVTGVGRYTADMNLTGQLHAKFKYAAHTHARITRIDTSKAKAAPGRLRRAHARGRSRGALRRHGAGPADVREGRRAVRGRRGRGRRRHHRRDRRGGRRADRGRLRAAAGQLGHRGGDRRRRDADPRDVVGLQRRRDDGPRQEHARPLDHHPRRRGGGDGLGRRRREGPLRGRLLAGRPDRAAGASSRSGRATRSRSGPPPRCRSRRARAWPPCSRSPSRTCGSSCRCSAAASAPSATSTSRATSRRSPAPPGGP